MSIDRTYELDTKHASHIPESVSDRLYDSIARIEKNSFYGTGFFLKIKIKEKIKYFFITCGHVITKNDINSEISFDIYYGKKNSEIKKTIKIDSHQRFFAYFGGKQDVTIIEILKKDKIPENKFLIPDLSYKYGYDIYKEEKCLLAGYPRDQIYEKERHISSGEIKKIKGFEFKHTLDTRKGSSGAPVCLIKNIQVIGIHKQGNTKECINYGTFIGTIIDQLEKVFKEKKIVNNAFITLEDYNNQEILSLHKEILNYYNNQNENNYFKAINELKEYLNNKKEIKNKDEFIENLEIFKNMKKNYKKIIKLYTGENSFCYFMNRILRENDKLSLKKFNYFIGGFLKALDISGNILNCGIKYSCQVYRIQIIPLKDLILFKENINKIISFKSFISVSPLATKISSDFMEVDKMFQVLFKINYDYKENCELDFFDITKLSKYPGEKEHVFRIFSFFKVINVVINKNKKQAEIIMDSIGRMKGIENELSKLKEINNVKIIFNQSSISKSVLGPLNFLANIFSSKVIFTYSV
jgi:V8-like Glu-specific endopeptidase